MICNSKKILDDAVLNNYAVPAFNVHNLETMRACFETAHQLKSAVIVAFTPKTMCLSKPTYLHAIACAASKIYRVPICLHLDHFKDFDEIKLCLEIGIKSVMIDGSTLPFLENVKLTKKVVQLARAYDATVEAELGKLQRVINHQIVEVADVNHFSDPKEILEFVVATKIDSISVAFGNAHGVYLKNPVLNYNIIQTATKLLVAQKIYNFPFVLHGGSGLTEDQIQMCIKVGIAKVNVGTELKPAFVKPLKMYLDQNPNEYDPRLFLPIAVDNLKKLIASKIKTCQSNNRY